jgi:hypothetical protein
MYSAQSLMPWTIMLELALARFDRLARASAHEGDEHARATAPRDAVTADRDAHRER